MKLVYIANIRLPTEKAHGIQIMKMCEAFAGRGIEVELLVPKRWNDLQGDPFEFYKIRKVFRLTRVPCLDFVNFDVAGIGFAVSTLTFLIAAKFYLFFRPYDILYTREKLSGLFFRNTVLELHSLPERMSGIYKFLLHRISRVIVLTSFTKAHLAEAGFIQERISVMPDAVDIDEFNPDISKEAARMKLGLPAGKKIILYTGSFLLYKWKGGDLLPAAAEFLSDDYLFLLVGGHPWEIEKFNKSLKLKNTLLIPYVRHETIPYYLKAADILVLPNRSGNKASEMYTSPLKLFEYMASGRPIIASNIASLREILTGDDAVFFNSDDARDLARAISSLAGDKKMQEQLSRHAYSKVSQYTWDKRADKIIKWISH